MQITQSTKPTPRAFRRRIVAESLNRPEIQRLEGLYENSSSVKSTNWNPNRTNPNVLNGQSTVNIQQTHSQRRRAKANSIIDDRIVINICGSRYETHRTTLDLYPDTLLGNVKRRKYYYDKHRKEYFFDRNRACFEAILYYYQSHGRLRRPDYISLDIFLEEVTFFQLGQEALNQLRKDENIKQIKKIPLPKNRILRYIWATMEYPGYSLTAKIVNVISLLMVLLSTILLAIESLPQYVNLDDLNCQKDSNSSLSTTTVNSYINSTANSNPTQNLYTCPIYYTSPFFIIQAICIGYFTIELILRIIATPSIIHFIKNIMNWIDFAAVIPFYVTLGIRLSGQEQDINSNTYISLRLLRILRLARVFKFFRIFRSVKSLRVLVTTVRQSLLDFFIMIVLLTLLGFLFGAAAYYAENDSNGVAFDSIPKATYWGIITVTSVGYGDITPISPTGRVIACLCALFGAATVGMLVSVLVDRYQRVYTRKLFVEEEIPDFDDYSDDGDNESRNLSLGSRHRGSLRIEDPDARAKKNAAHNSNNNNITEPPNLQEDLPIEIDENPMKHHGSRVHFILGYLDDENQETSHAIVEKISSVVADKRLSGDDTSLNIIPDETSPMDVQFQFEDYNDDDDDDDEDEDEDQDFTEISPGCIRKGNVLKTFQLSSCPNDEKLKVSEEKL